MKRTYSTFTAPKLIAAILLGATGYFASEMHLSLAANSGSAFPYWVSNVGAICFAIIGWKSLGPRPGFGGMASIALGWRAAILALFVTCIVYGMLYQGQALLNGQYLDPFKTIFDWFRISFEFMVDTFSLPVWGILLIGGAIAGRATGTAFRHWR